MSVTHSAMLVRRQVVTIDHFEDSGWARVPDLESATEVRTIIAVLTNGERITREATIRYEPGERERIFEAMVIPNDGTQSTQQKIDAALDGIIKVKLRRARAVQDVYGALQREYKRV